jgi:putative membrane protein
MLAEIVQIMNPTVVAATIVYAAIGIIIFCLSFVVIDKLTPGDMWKELIEKQNIAVAIVAGFAVLGVCIIVAAAIH